MYRELQSCQYISPARKRAVALTIDSVGTIQTALGDIQPALWRAVTLFNRHLESSGTVQPVL